MQQEIQFTKAVFKLSDLPGQHLPEIVLCGRSNVGKSSFINSFFNKSVAKTSSTPGKTRSLNYYLVNNKYFMVDLPGYGYAKVSMEERNKWAKLVANYFTAERNFSLIIHILDSRHKPTSLDIYLNNFLKGKGLNYIFLLTKIDKLKQSEVKNSKKEIINTFPEAVDGENMFIYSSVRLTGKKELFKKINVTLSYEDDVQ
jgi:GTP-binding protein